MTVDSAQPKPFGELLLQELLWIHSILRRDLQTVRRLAEDVLAGAEPERVSAEIGALETNSPLWQIRTNCLYYCRFVHGHHRFEDMSWFPALRRSDPALDPVVDKLEADHRLISTYLDEVRAAANLLVKEDTADSRSRVIEALNGLADHLLTHLAYEEGSIGPTLRTWESWPAD